MRIRISTAFYHAVLQPVSRNRTIPMRSTATLPPRRLSEYAPFSAPPTASHSTVFAAPDSYAEYVARELMVFASQRENITGNKRCDTNNRQAAHRCARSKFQAVCPGSNNEKKNSTMNQALASQCHTSAKARINRLKKASECSAKLSKCWVISFSQKSVDARSGSCAA